VSPEELAEARLAMLRELEAENTRLRAACIALHAALSRIDYACGNWKNGMGLSIYDLDGDESAVVERVEVLRVEAGNAGYRQGHADGCDDEREAIAVWLREPGEHRDPACARLADCIERGDHRRTNNKE
jgi:hypothetical protein